jgi:hypothetical protein
MRRRHPLPLAVFAGTVCIAATVSGGPAAWAASPVAEPAAFPVSEPAAFPIILDGNGQNHLLPSIAADGLGNYVMTWTLVEALSLEVVARLFDPQGQPLGPVLHVSTISELAPPSRSVAMNARGDFVVAWSGGILKAQSHDVRAQLFARDGSRIGPEVTVDSSPTDRTPLPAVGVDGERGFAVAWQAPQGVLVRRFDRAGAPLGHAVPVSFPLPSDQPGLAMQPDGSFTVVWTGLDPRGRTAIFGRRFGTDGEPEGNVLRISQSPLVFGGQTTAAAMADGGFVASWITCGFNLKTPPCEVHVRRFDAGGRPLSSDLRASPDDGRSYWQPVVAAGPRGDFAVVSEDCPLFAFDCRASARVYNRVDAPQPAASKVAIQAFIDRPYIAASPRGFIVVFSTLGCVIPLPECNNSAEQGIYGWRLNFPRRPDRAAEAADGASP